MVRTQPDDDGDRQLLDDIASHGWHLVAIEADEAGPAYVFSVGIYQTLHQPELCIFGLSSDVAMAQILNSIGDLMRDGIRFEDGDISDDVLSGYACAFRSVKSDCYREYFGYACWYYEGLDFPMLQCIWPDREGRFPWQQDFDAMMVRAQPVLAEMSGWRFVEPKNQAVFTTVGVIELGNPILHVVHDEDGDWQFLCGGPTTLSQAKLVCLANIVQAHPSVEELADLPRVWTATRESPGQPWKRIRM